jgi:hypothetical protein
LTRAVRAESAPSAQAIGDRSDAPPRRLVDIAVTDYWRRSASAPGVDHEGAWHDQGLNTPPDGRARSGLPVTPHKNSDDWGAVYPPRQARNRDHGHRVAQRASARNCQPRRHGQEQPPDRDGVVLERKTVESDLAHVFARLGVSARAAVAAQISAEPH